MAGLAQNDYQRGYDAGYAAGYNDAEEWHEAGSETLIRLQTGPGLGGVDETYPRWIREEIARARKEAAFEAHAPWILMVAFTVIVWAGSWVLNHLF